MNKSLSHRVLLVDRGASFRMNWGTTFFADNGSRKGIGRSILSSRRIPYFISHWNVPPEEQSFAFELFQERRELLFVFLTGRKFSVGDASNWKELSEKKVKPRCRSIDS